MKALISYLNQKSITEPKLVNTFLISAFVQLNQITFSKNKFIERYIIQKENPYIKHYQTFLSLISNTLDPFTLEDLIKLFEFVISPSDRVISGAIYTPDYIRDYIVDSLVYRKKIRSRIFVDISCGCGGFLLTTANKIRIREKLTYKEIYKKYIFGLDIQDYSINRTKILLTLNALLEGEDDEFQFNLFIDDALTFQWGSVIKDFEGFDYIIGNPPYVCAKNLSESSKQYLKNWSVSKSGNTDLYIPFFQIAIENLKKNGTLGFITMNSFFKSLNARLLRYYFQSLSLDFKIIDFGFEQIFKARNTYTCLCFIKKTHNTHVDYKNTSSNGLSKLNQIQFEKIAYENLNARTGWNLKNHQLIQKIENTGTPFGYKFTTRHGIATLKNNIYIFKPHRKDRKYYYFYDESNSEINIERKICRDIYNTNKLSSMQKADNLVEKVIFPYNTKNGETSLILEDELSKKFPATYNYLKGKKSQLALRDKGKGNYPVWYAFGRTQSLHDMKYKLFFPKYSSSNPFFIINDDESVKFYNGLALIGSSIRELEFARIIMQTRLFWFYISSTSKPYSAGYYSLNGNYIHNFGVYDFSADEIDYLRNEISIEKINKFFEKKYEINLDKFV